MDQKRTNLRDDRVKKRGMKKRYIKVRFDKRKGGRVKIFAQCLVKLSRRRKFLANDRREKKRGRGGHRKREWNVELRVDKLQGAEW